MQADRHSGVAIAGAAGPAMEMIKLFQLQLEHYEKVEGSALSLEGKANQLSHDGARQPAGGDAGHGGGADLRRLRPAPPARVGCSSYDVTGGRYEEHDYVATGSGSLHAGTVIKVGCRDGLDRDAAVALACRSLWEAADADSATGGPDALRGIYPVVATITADGWQRLDDDELAAALRGDRRRRCVSDEHAVLRRTRTGDEGPCRLRAQGHRPRPRAGRRPLRRRHRAGRREPVATRCARSARSTTASPSPASASTTSSTSCASPASAPPT